jgi:hypothetical protein
MLPDAGRHDKTIHEAWPYDPHLLIAILCKGGCGGGELYTIRDIQRVRHSMLGEAPAGPPPHQIGGSRAVVGEELSGPQHLALTRLASQPDWCEAVEIGAAPVIIGRLRANGLVDRLAADRLRTHRQRYRINSAGFAALEGWTPPPRSPVRKRRQSRANAIALATIIAGELAEDGSIDGWVSVTDEDGKEVCEVPIVKRGKSR